MSGLKKSDLQWRGLVGVLRDVEHVCGFGKEERGGVSGVVKGQGEEVGVFGPDGGEVLFDLFGNRHLFGKPDLESLQHGVAHDGSNLGVVFDENFVAFFVGSFV